MSGARFAQSLSQKAISEAVRAGQQTADIEHLFIALTLTTGYAGQTLRSLGINALKARAAVEVQRQIASPLTAATNSQQAGHAHLGAQPTLDAETTSTNQQLTDRAIKLLQQATATDTRDYGVVLLTKLLEEPSGTIKAMLHRIDSTPEELQEKLPRFIEPEITIATDSSSASKTIFLALSPDIIREKLIDPLKAHYWHIGIESISQTETPDTWQLEHTAHEKLKPEFIRQLLRLNPSENPYEIIWELWFPDATKPHHRTITFTIKPQADGTQLTVTFQWRNHPQRVLFTSIRRYLLKLHIFHITTKLRQNFNP